MYPTRDKILVVGLDGVRFDRVASIRPSVLQSLADAGACGTGLLPYGEPSAPACTDSGPGWSTVATGVWPNKHGVTDNSFTAPHYERFPDFLTRAKAIRPELSTFAIFSWDALARHGTFGPAIDVRIVLDGERDTYEVCDDHVADLAARYLAEQDPDVAFVYFGATDEVAHAQGPLCADYRAALLRQDEHLGRLLDAIRGRAEFPEERWTILVTTDHGHLDAGGHGGDSTIERTIFLVLAELDRVDTGPPIDARLVDIAPTVLDRLGIAIDAAWDLDGTPLRR